MDILIISQDFPPDVGGAATRIFGFAKGLSDLGNNITVLCSNPIYPKGEIFPGYKNKSFQQDNNFKDFDVFRSYICPVKPSSSFSKRLLSYFSFVLSSGFYLSKLKINPDVVIVCVPQLFISLTGIKAKKIFKTKLYLDITDAWPESAVATGFMKRGILFKIAENFEKWVYKRCDYFLASAQGIKDHLIKQGVDEDKVTLVYDAADISLFEKSVDNTGLIEKYGLKNKFVVGFTGLMGFAQNPISIVEAAHLLSGYDDIYFLLVGDGGKREEAENAARTYGLSNIKFVGQVPREEMPKYTSLFSVCLIPYKNEPLFKLTIPGKLFDYLASGKPIVINTEGRAADIVLGAGAGLIAHSGDSQDFANKILEIYDNPTRGEELGRSGRDFVKKYYDRRELIKKLNDFLIHTK